MPHSAALKFQVILASMTKPKALAGRLVAALGSQAAWRIILGLLVLQAAWIALSGRYPMACDEDFHLGIIRVYAHHLSPFWSHQPAGTDMFGAVSREPSYLYQYLVRFPYRLISVYTHDQTIQVLVLRAINIGLFAWGLGLYRRLLLKAGESRTVGHACLLALVLIPVVPLLAAQINYDNLILPLTAATLLLCLQFEKDLRKRQLNLKVLWELLILGLLTSLVKYAFLPILLAVAGFIGVRLWQHRRKLSLKLNLLRGWQKIDRLSRVWLTLALVLASGLFAQRYVVNVVRYHTPVPACNQVLSVKQCIAYGPWARDYIDELANVQPSPPHLRLTFTHAWLYGLWLRTFFAVDGPGTQFETRAPLLFPGLAAIGFAVISGLALLSRIPSIIKTRRSTQPELWLFGVVSFCYIAVLWQDEYKAFAHTGQPVAINGRYLLPVLPLIFLLVALALRQVLQRWQGLKLALLAIAVGSLLWGGGALTYILRSNPAWYWPNSNVRSINRAVQDTLGPLTPGYRHPTQFLH